MVIFRSLVVIAILAAFLCVGVGCSSKDTPSQATGKQEESQPAAESKPEQPVAATDEKLPGVQQQEQAESAPATAMPKTLALTGTIAQEGDQIMLVTDLGDYVVAGQDLSSMIGKSVNVTGAVEEADGKYTINVLSFSEN